MSFLSASVSFARLGGEFAVLHPSSSNCFLSWSFRAQLAGGLISRSTLPQLTIGVAASGTISRQFPRRGNQWEAGPASDGLWLVGFPPRWEVELVLDFSKTSRDRGLPEWKWTFAWFRPFLSHYCCNWCKPGNRNLKDHVDCFCNYLLIVVYICLYWEWVMWILCVT